MDFSFSAPDLVDTPLEDFQRPDPNGRSTRARNGTVAHITKLFTPYEGPEAPA